MSTFPAALRGAHAVGLLGPRGAHAVGLLGPHDKERAREAVKVFSVQPPKLKLVK